MIAVCATYLLMSGSSVFLVYTLKNCSEDEANPRRTTLYRMTELSLILVYFIIQISSTVFLPKWHLFLLTQSVILTVVNTVM